ncbi:MAG: hypothetical protein DRP41_05110 [Thermodesulfobacteriota bacterium]|nr:MAG: hypothetical protein DRP41_05110 [Thermodesulfobacteriota bacterium]
MYSLKLDSFHVVLVAPAIAGNIGATARILKNFNINSLILVNPLASPLHPEALAHAKGAKDILSQASVFQDLRDAIAPFHYIVGTTARIRHKRPVLFLREILPFLTSLSQQNEIALVFGPERTGLTNEALDLCHSIITIPTSSKHSSLNLAQAVAVVLYELYYHHLEGRVAQALPPLAKTQELDKMYEHLINSLSKIGFVLGGEKKHTYRVMKRLFNKIPLTVTDMKVIRGICHQIDWFASVKNKK